jgi:hypothetical protein
MEIMNMTKLVLRFISVMMLMLAGASIAKIDPKTAVGIWVFNEGTGKKAQDASDNGNDGTLQNGPKWVEGKWGKGLEFNGTDDYVEVPDTDSLDITDEITVVGWVYPYFYGRSESKKPIPGDGSSVNILSKMVSENSYIGPFWWEYRNNGNLNAYFAAVPDGTYLTPTIADLSVDTWSHLASSYDSATGIATVYLNAAVVVAQTNPNFGALREGVEFILGTGKGGGDYGNYFNGTIDEVAIFHSVLDSSDLERIMNLGLEKALGLTSVSLAGKLTTTWASVKAQD